MNERGGIRRIEKGAEKNQLHSKIISGCLRHTQSSSLPIFSSCLVLLGADWQGFHNGSVWSVFCLGQVQRRPESRMRMWYLFPQLSPCKKITDMLCPLQNAQAPAGGGGPLHVSVTTPSLCPAVLGPSYCPSSHWLPIPGPHLCKGFLYKTQSLSQSMPHGDPDWYKYQKENGGSLIRFRTGKEWVWRVPTLLSLHFLYKSYLKGAL